MSTRDGSRKGGDGKRKKAKEGSRLNSSLSSTHARDKVRRITATFKKEAIGLNDFEKIRHIGKGAIGEVYLVRNKGSDKLFAMKEIKKHEMIQLNKVKRVLTEREILATADHPFIVNLYYSFQSEESIHFIMQYCAGGQFYNIIKRQPFRCLKEDDARFYASEVLLALEYLHMMGFIYRDLKPENVLMHASGHILLVDFDLSKQATTAVQPRVVTKMFSGHSGVVAEPDLVTNSFVGTEEYLAPEVVQGTGHNATVDWWTFGILMYEMLYGFTPFRGANQDKTFSNILQKNSLSFPQQKRGGISKECKILLKALLHRNPQKRLGSSGGATDIKDAPFFKDTKWVLIRNTEPPIKPRLMDKVGKGERIDDDIKEIDPGSLAADHPFRDFENFDRTKKPGEKTQRSEKVKERTVSEKNSKEKSTSEKGKDREKAKTRRDSGEKKERRDKDKEGRGDRKEKERVRKEKKDESSSSTSSEDKKDERKHKTHRHKERDSPDHHRHKEKDSPDHHGERKRGKKRGKKDSK